MTENMYFIEIGLVVWKHTTGVCLYMYYFPYTAII